MSYKVALIGRPNVGKSTFFNRLVGKKLAIVNDQPGVTRDRRYGAGALLDLEFTVIDTAGFEYMEEGLSAQMQAQSRNAIEEADLILFMVDGREGITPLDRVLAQDLRSQTKPVFVVVNKCESANVHWQDAYQLGFDIIVPLSGEHGQGIDILYEEMLNFEKQHFLENSKNETTEKPDLHIAIVGRPNAGKSTLANKIFGEDRLLTGPEAGITRDAIPLDMTWRDKHIRLVDTAGLRRRAKVEEPLEKQSTMDSIRAIKYAEVVFLVMEADHPLEKQDLVIAQHIIQEGRILIPVINKIDLIESTEVLKKQIQHALEQSLPQIKGVPILLTSAVGKVNVDELFKVAFKMYEAWNIRIPTAKLNKWLAVVLEQHTPPMISGRRIKIRYMTQIKARPPTFVLFVTKPADLPDSYLRYMENQLRDVFKMPGIPLRLLARKGDNPYAE